MPVKFIVLVIVYLADLLLLTPKYIKCKYDHTALKRKIMWKELCVGIPFLALLCGVAIKYITGSDDETLSILLAGMFLCVVGDAVLEIKFGAGVVCFAMGHVVYIVAIISLGYGVNVASIVVYALLAVLGTVLTLKLLGKNHKAQFIIYNLVVSTSFALSVPLLMTGEASLIVLGCGIISLVISDWLLARNKVFKSNFKWSLFAIIPYFGGQILISLYPWFVTW